MQRPADVVQMGNGVFFMGWVLIGEDNSVLEVHDLGGLPKPSVRAIGFYNGLCPTA